jgi:RNA polymerase sigma factor (sigma-70 family)
MLRNLETKQNKDEIALWQALKRGDREAFGQIYERYIEALYSYGYCFTKNKALIEDAVHELFVDLWRMKENLSDITEIKYYLFRSLQRKILHLMDVKEVFAKIPHLPADISTEDRLILEEQNKENVDILSKGLTLLPQRQLQAVRLRFYDGLETDQIAKIMDMNEQSVRNTIQRALQKLRLEFRFVLWLVFLCC